MSTKAARAAAIQKKRPATVTLARDKRIQDFKTLSQIDPTRYGVLGSRKWAHELHAFMDDKKVKKEDVNRWIRARPDLQRPLQNTETTLRRSPLIRPPKAWNRHESPAGRRSIGVSQFQSATSGIPFPSPGNMNSEYSGTPAIPPQTQDLAVVPVPQPQPVNTLQPHVSAPTETLNEISSGLNALLTLGRLAEKYDSLKCFHYQITKMYKGLEMLQKTTIVPKKPEPKDLNLGVKQEVVMWNLGVMKMEGTDRNLPTVDVVVL